MVWMICVLALILNEYSAGEGWYKGAVRSLCAVGLAAALAALFPAQVLMAAIILLAAVTAGELYKAGEKRPPIPMSRTERHAPPQERSAPALTSRPAEHRRAA